MKILVVTEQRQNKWNNTSFETLAAAQQIATETNSTVSALVIGKGVAALADELAAKNVAEVLLVENDLLENYTPDGYCVALKQVIESANPISFCSRTPIKSATSLRNSPRCWAKE